MTRRRLSLALLLLLLIPALLAVPAHGAEMDYSAMDQDYYGRYRGQGRSLNVYNWGEYISDGSDGSLDVNKAFEELTGIKVVYSTFDTNESLYAKLKTGGSSYDIIIPSDYMIARMIREGMLEKLDFDNIPNFENISSDFRNLVYDPSNEYSVPYTWGTIGVIYNKTVVDEEDIGGWDLLWNQKYLGDILMFSNPRDDFGIALKRLGYPMNPQNTQHLSEALELLKEQKMLVQAYVMDEIFDKLRDSKLEIIAELASAQLSLSDIYHLNVGDVIDLGQPKESPIYLEIGGYHWFTGKMGTHKKNMAVKIDEVCCQLEQRSE